MKGLLLLLLALAFGRRGAGGGARPGGLGARPKGLQPPASFTPTAPRPPGSPPGGCVYSPKLFPTQLSVLEAFAAMGYPVPVDRPTMNALGKDGKLGGGDDEPSIAVARFQDDYNAASAEGVLGPMAGGLAVDGYVGPCVLSAIQHVHNAMGLAGWRDVIEVVRG